MSTCFWTDLVNTAQVCPDAPPPDPPPVLGLSNFVFGPVQNSDSSALFRASNATFSAWPVAGNIGDNFEFSLIAYGPGSTLFTDPTGALRSEHNFLGYWVAAGFSFVYTNGFSFNGSGNTAGIGRGGSSPPYIQHPTVVVSDGSRWWRAEEDLATRVSYADDGATWTEAPTFPASRHAIAMAARSGIVAAVCRGFSTATNTLVWSLNGGSSWSTLALAAGPVENLAIAMSPTQVYRAAGTSNTNAQFSNTTALGTATNVGGAFPKRRAWWTGTAWLVERLSTPVQIQRYTDLSTAGTSVFSFPAGTTPCGAFLAMGGGRIVVPALLSSPANHVDFYVSTDDGATFAVAPGMRMDIGDGGTTGYVHGFSIAYRPPI